MKVLYIHARKFSYSTVSPAVDQPEDVSGKSSLSLNDVLVVFTTVEADDDEVVVDKAVEDVVDVRDKVKALNILIYPYAHLSSELAGPVKAFELLVSFEEKLRSRLKEGVYRAPFGWYKEFTLECYGHPLSELSRTFKATVEPKRRVVEKKFFILTPGGVLYEPSGFDYSGYPELKILVDKEVFGRELPGGENRVNDYCSKFGFEWEPMSDFGHMRYGPHASMIMDLVSKYSWRVVKELDIPLYRVQGTNMFNLKEKPVQEHAVLFGDRLYELNVDNDKFVLRYAACHQQFAMLKDWVISYKDLPFGVFEVADSYRLEQRGELNLCYRVRKFYMPDLHILTRDLEEAYRVSLVVQRKIIEEASKVGRRYVALYNVAEDFLNEHRDKLLGFVKQEGAPVLLNVIPTGIYYWVLNVEYHIIDNIGRPREIATFQIDVGNSKRFDITYVDENNERRHVVIIHTAIIGSVERYVYMLLDTAAYLEKNNKVPCLPTWVSPIQIRVIPVSKQYLNHAIEVAKELSSRGFRVDVDDRDESLGKKIRDAGVEWIPYVAVIGEREVETSTLNVRIRSEGVQKIMGFEELVKSIEEEVKGYPTTDLYLPLLLSKRTRMNYVK